LLTKDAIEAYIKAGRIASEARRDVEKLVRGGASILDICEGVEKIIMKKGGVPAFPCNVCVNEVAAHYSSPPRDFRVIPEGGLVKVDIGVHVDGYIADTATTVSLNPELDIMVQAVREALERAIKVIVPGIRARRIGETIQGTIEEYGFKPIRNLSGHQITRYILHTGKSIPNIDNFDFNKIEEGEVYAVEPFLTRRSGSGLVAGISKEAHIYRFNREKRVKTQEAKKLLKIIRVGYRSLPFSKRWLVGKLPDEALDRAFQELIGEKCIASYPVLVEETGEWVAQAEHTLIVTKDGALVTTY
jgi:methionyl aminopeptidase